MAKPGISISIDWSHFLERCHGLRRPALDRPVALALVDTAKAANVKAASSIARHTGLRSATVKQRLFYDRVNIGDYQTYLRSSRRLIPLMQFGARQTNPGVRAARPWGKPQVFKSTFIATMPSGHRGVFRRSGSRSLPIKEMMGPSIHGTFAQPSVQATVRATIRQRLPVLLARRIKSEQRRAGRG
jgi:hypothetical protein